MAKPKIILKNQDELQIMRDNGKIQAEIFQQIREMLKPGISTLDIDKMVEEAIVAKGGKPSFKGYEGFPGSICSSVNDVVIHGIPDQETVLKNGDIIGIDMGIYRNGFHVDSAFTFAIGEIDAETKKLCDVTLESLKRAITMCRKGKTLFDVSNVVQSLVEDNGFSVVREFVGHGVGKELHEAPQIPNYRKKGLSKIKLRPGMTLAVEPMVNAGTADIVVRDDQWTICTADGKPSAHYEHTVAITDKGPLIITAP